MPVVDVARQNADQENGGMGEFGMDFVHHAADAVEGFFFRIAASRVIGADHDLDHFGGDMVQDSLAPDSCQDVIRRIAVEACIEGIVGSIVFFPDGQKVLAGEVVLTVVVRDGVSDGDQMHLIGVHPVDFGGAGHFSSLVLRVHPVQQIGEFIGKDGVACG